MRPITPPFHDSSSIGVLEYWSDGVLEVAVRIRGTEPIHHTSAEIEEKIFFLLCVLSASAVRTPMHPTADIHRLFLNLPNNRFGKFFRRRFAAQIRSPDCTFDQNLFQRRGDSLC